MEGEERVFGQVFGFERPLYFGAATTLLSRTLGRPDWFGQVAAEVAAAHGAAGVTELSSFGKIDVSGPDALACLEKICTNRIDRPVGRACYTLMLNRQGGIESDLTKVSTSLLGTDSALVVGTAALKQDMSWIRNNLPAGASVEVTDVTSDLAVLGLCRLRASSLGAGRRLDA